MSKIFVKFLTAGYAVIYCRWSRTTFLPTHSSCLFHERWWKAEKRLSCGWGVWGSTAEKGSGRKLTFWRGKKSNMTKRQMLERRKDEIKRSIYYISICFWCKSSFSQKITLTSLRFAPSLCSFLLMRWHSLGRCFLKQSQASLQHQPLSSQSGFPRAKRKKEEAETDGEDVMPNTDTVGDKIINVGNNESEGEYRSFSLIVNKLFLFQCRSFGRILPCSFRTH